jgi:hypothetical protein
VFEGAGLQLFPVIDHDHGVLVVVVMLKAGHADDSLSVCLILPNRKAISEFFYSLNASQHARLRNGGEAAM